jgi:WD40 repeat protein
LWDVASGQELKTLKGHPEGVFSVTFSPDGKTLASGSADNTIKLWNLASGQELKTLTGHSKFVRSVSFSPDGKTLASRKRRHTIKLWNVASGQELKTLTGHSKLCVQLRSVLTEDAAAEVWTSHCGCGFSARIESPQRGLRFYVRHVQSDGKTLAARK